MDYRKQRGSSIPPKVFGKEGRRVVCRCSMGGIMANVAVQAVAIDASRPPRCILDIE